MYMIYLVAIVGFFVLSWVWIKLINGIFDPIINWLEKPIDVNSFIYSHERIEKGIKKVKSFNDAISESDRKRAVEYQEYLKWCNKKGIKPNQEPPVQGKLKMMHIS